MLSTFLSALPTILIALALLFLLSLAIRTMVRDKKKGHGDCGGACAGCALRDACHTTASPQTKEK